MKTDFSACSPPMASQITIPVYLDWSKVFYLSTDNKMMAAERYSYRLRLHHRQRSSQPSEVDAERHEHLSATRSC